MERAKLNWGEASLILGGKLDESEAAAKARAFKALVEAKPSAEQKPNRLRLTKKKRDPDKAKAKRKAQRHARRRA